MYGSGVVSCWLAVKGACLMGMWWVLVACTVPPPHVFVATHKAIVQGDGTRMGKGEDSQIVRVSICLCHFKPPRC